MFKLALTAGHYMGTAGKRCMKKLDPKETREWWLNDRIADKIEKMLSEYKDVTILRTDDTTGAKDVSLSARVNAANKFDADFYLSIHHNAGIKGGNGGGISAYVYKNCSSASRKWQSDLYDALIDATGLKGNRSKPLQDSGLYEVKYTNMPAVLLELGFMDSATDVPVILSEDFATACAKACVSVIVAKGNLVKKPAPAPKPATTVLMRGSSGDKVFRLQNLLNLLGYNCGTADGDFGAKTEVAVTAFQKAMKLTQDGKFGKDSFNAMKRALASTKIVLSKNTKVVDNRVRGLQNIISDYGFNCLDSKGVADGIYGSATMSAVQKYQKSRGLGQDGKAGPKTIGTFVDYLVL